MESTGERIKRLRELKNLTQEELAKKVNVEAPAISKYETNRVPIPTETLKLLSKIFNKSADYILGINDDITSGLEQKDEINFATHIKKDYSKLSRKEQEEIKNDINSYAEFILKKYFNKDK